ncbi:MAG TPA: ABC transporter substrate-binding protein [Candidatus Anaerofilum faecale]|nr:ABC transporter substrate-binding protein [Anaerofilum sp. An201]OUP03830.1 peptide ABC transporter substrate-binding protein [Anaerofilum sp. An201]HIX12710.1 ABC transporter substrate-binding protein [Candidatus Anaerofilum faecale]
MKRFFNVCKKALCVLSAGALFAGLLAGCGAAPADDGVLHVGLIQYMEHTSLDEIRTALEAQLEARAAEEGLTIEVDVQNAQGDPTNINSICTKFVSDGVDAIVAIATPAAAGAAGVTEDIPIVFSAVTDPVTDLQLNSLDAPGGNVTGTSDNIPVEEIFRVAGELTPDASHFGLLYCTSEPSSAGVIENAKACLDGEGKTYTEAAITNASEVQQAAQTLAEQCDAIFIPIDNTVAKAMSVVAETAIEAKIPVYVSADSMVKDGGLASAGVNYTNLGQKTADMVIEVLKGADPATMPVQTMDDVNVVVNEETAAAIGVDVSAYTE